MDRELLDGTDFFTHMQSFGFFDHVDKHLPDDFTIIFEIARVLENEEHSFTKQLAPVLYQDEVDHALNPHAEKFPIPHLPAAEEYEADLMSNYRELARIYPYQFCLPSDVFDQKLAERTLWMPRPKMPKTYRYQSESDLFKPDIRKQKVYLLFDTSASMQLKFRSHLAKAIGFFFLKQNMKELGTVYFRTFDAQIGPLQTAIDVPSFEDLIHHIMQLHPIGRGTALELALETAINDIKRATSMAWAEILVITDGAAHLNLEKLRAQLTEGITINAIKIGNADISLDSKSLHNEIYQAKTEEALHLREIMNHRLELRNEFNRATTKQRKSQIEGEVRMLDRQIDSLAERVGKNIKETYGREIESLATAFVQIDDMDPETLFALTKGQEREYEIMTEQLIAILEHEASPDDLKRAALLFDHLESLLKYNVKSAELAHLARKLQATLRELLNTGEDIDHHDLHLNQEMENDLKNILSKSFGMSRMSFAKALRRAWRNLKLMIKRSLHFLRYRIIKYVIRATRLGSFLDKNE